MTTILGISGKKQSGKSSLTKYIRDNLHLLTKYKTINIYSYADEVKNMCCNIMGLTSQQCWGTDDDKNSITKYRFENMPEFKDGMPTGLMTARQVLQHVGTNIFRKMDPNIWVYATIRKIQKEKYDLALIDDVRFKEEVEAIYNFSSNSKVIRLTRAPFKDIDFHPSETALDGYDNFSLVLENHKMTKEESCEKLGQYLKETYNV